MFGRLVGLVGYTGMCRGDFSIEANFFDFRFFGWFYFLTSGQKLYLDSGGLVEVCHGSN